TSRSRASGLAAHTLAPTGRSWTSATQPHPVRVVERRRRDGRGDVAGAKDARELGPDRAEPPEADRSVGGLGHRARGDPADDSAVERERVPALRRSVEAE